MVADLDLFLIKIQAVHPPLNSHLTLYMLENFGVGIHLDSPYPVEDLEVQIWTNILTKFNSEGVWYGYSLNYQSQDSKDTLIFQGSLMPTSPGNYQFTYRVALKNNQNQWLWAGRFQENGYLRVEPPSPWMGWTQGPSYVEVFPHVYVGNFIAASQADELEIDAVINLASEFNLNFPILSKVNYKKLGILDGAHHPIPDEVLLEAVGWIDEQVKQGKKKVLINCRAGIGRSGSLGVAYCFYKNPSWSYQQTLDYIWSKKADIYPHKHLQASLERLFPRGGDSTAN